MSGDGHTNETRELNLDAILERADRAVIYGDPDLHLLNDLVNDDVPAMVAEVRRLREQVARVEALLTAWDEIPDYAPSHYDKGRVDQRHMAAEELAAVLADTTPTYVP